MEADILFLTSFIIFSFFLSSFPLSHSLPEDHYRECCDPSPCGKLNISYPFWSKGHRGPHCGSPEFQLTCNEDEFPSIQISSQTFNATRIDPSAYRMKLVRTGLVYDNCSSDLTSTSLSSNLFSYEPNVKNLTLFYNCPPDIPFPRNSFTCHSQPYSDSYSNCYAFYSEKVEGLSGKFSELKHCGRSIRVPVSTQTDLDPEGDIQALIPALGEGFDVQYHADGSCGECMKSYGTCGSDDTSPTQCTCYCPDGPRPLDCYDSSSMRFITRSSIFS